MTIRDIAIAFGYEIDESSENAVKKSIDNLKGTATKLLGAIGIGFSLGELNKVAEEFNGINDKIRSATKGLGEQKEIQKKVLDTANDIKMSYSDAADIVSSLVSTSPKIFGNIDDAAKFTELTAKLFKTEGKSNEETKALQESINKSFNKGAVDAETINQLLEQSPRAVNLLCKSLNTSKEKLTDLCTNGKISLTQLRDAFLNNESSINAGYSELDLSISDAILNVKNQFGLLIDDINTTWHITKYIAQGIVKVSTVGINALRKFFDLLKNVADKIGGTDNMLKLMGATLASIMATVLISKGPQFLAFFNKLKTAIKGVNAKLVIIGAVILTIILLIDDFVNFMQGNKSVLGSVFEKLGVDGDKVRETISNLGTIIKAFIKELIDKGLPIIMELGKELVNKILPAVMKLVQKFMPVFKRILDSVVQLLPKLVEIVKRLFDIGKKLFDKLKDVGKKILEKALELLGKLVETVLPILVELFDKLWPVIEKAGEILSDVLLVAFNAIADILEKTVLPLFDGLIAFFEGDWDKGVQFAGEAFTGAFESAFSAIDSLFGTHLSEWYSEVQEFWMDVGSKLYEATHKDLLEDQELSSKYSSMQDDINSATMEALKQGKTVEEAMQYAKNTILDTSEKVYAFNRLAGTDSKFSFRYGEEQVKEWQDSLIKSGQIPAMAEGGLVTKPTLALVGEGSDDEAIIPLRKLAGIMAKAAATFVSKNTPGDSIETVQNTTNNRTITQNVSINNRFEGGLAAAQTKGASVMNSSANDATAILARGLAYSR